MATNRNWERLALSYVKHLHKAEAEVKHWKDEYVDLQKKYNADSWRLRGETMEVERNDALKKLAEFGGKLKEKSWRCFHCDEVFMVFAAAQEHFGTKGKPPACVDPLRADEKQRARHIFVLERGIERLRVKNESLENDSTNLAAMRLELGRDFGQCGGAEVSTAHQAWLVYEAKLGEIEALQARLAASEKARAEMREVQKNMGECVKHNAHRGVSFQCPACAREIYRLRLEKQESEKALRGAEARAWREVADWMDKQDGPVGPVSAAITFREKAAALEAKR